MKNEFALKILKKYLQKGDYSILIERIKEKHNLMYAASTIASVLSASTAHYNEIIYCEALLLALERQQVIKQTAALEAQLKED